MNGYNNVGRYMVTRPDGRRFMVEPLIDKDFVRKVWGDATVSTSGTWSGPTYGQKYPGGVEEKDSIITEANGFKNIVKLLPGVSPNSYIEGL